MTKIRANITGLGAYVPEYRLTNKELETMVDTNDAWIVSRTGIKERRILKGEGLGSSHMGAKAVEDLLEKTNTDAKDIELIICATTTPDFIFPATANLIADQVGAINSFSYDMQAACSGFLYTISAASQFIETGRYKKVIVVGADKMSSIVDYQDRATCVIFGDASAAVLLEPSEDGSGLIDFNHKVNGAGWVHLHQKAGGSRKPPTHESIDAREHYIYQEGSVVFKHAVKGMANASSEILERNNLTGKDVDWLVPHQANMRIIDATAEYMGLDKSKVMINIDKYGNTTNATIPLCLYEYENQLKKGDNLILAAFGGGFTWGAVYLKWGYNPQ